MSALGKQLYRTLDSCELKGAVPSFTHTLTSQIIGIGARMSGNDLARNGVPSYMAVAIPLYYGRPTIEWITPEEYSALANIGEKLSQRASVETAKERNVFGPSLWYRVGNGIF